MLGQMEGLVAADCVIGQLVAPYLRMQSFRHAPGHEIILDCLKRCRQSLYADSAFHHVWSLQNWEGDQLSFRSKSAVTR